MSPSFRRSFLLCQTSGSKTATDNGSHGTRGLNQSRLSEKEHIYIYIVSYHIVSYHIISYQSHHTLSNKNNMEKTREINLLPNPRKSRDQTDCPNPCDPWIILETILCLVLDSRKMIPNICSYTPQNLHVPWSKVAFFWGWSSHFE